MAANRKKQVQNLGWAGGVNLLADPKAIRDDQLANGKNCWPTREGILSKRHALAAERVAIALPTTQYHPISMFVPDPVTGFDFVLHYADTNGDEWLRAGPFAASLEADCPAIKIAVGNPLSYRPLSYVNYRGSVIAVGAGNEGFFQLTRASGSGLWSWHHVSFDWTLFDKASTQTQVLPVTPRVVGVYRDRLVFANFGVGMGNWLIMADRVGPWVYQDPSTNDEPHRDNVPLWSQVGPDVLALNGHHIEIVSLQGQYIDSVEEISTASVANALQRALMVRTNTRANIVTGEIAETTDTGTTYSSYLGDWVPADVNIDAGIAGPNCHCRGPNGVFWASGEDVYALYDGAPRPVVIGTNIRPALKACPPSLHKMWSMAYADGCVYLSVATQNSVDELNLTVQHWRLDVRPIGDGDETAKPMGPNEARWWGPQDYEHIPGASVSGGAGMGCCIVSRRGQNDQDTVYSLVLMDGNNAGDNDYLFLVSFNRVVAGHDSPYLEVLSARQWTANEAVAVGDIIRGTPLSYDGFFYAVTGAGITGGAEPVWPGVGAGFLSGTATLREMSTAADAREYVGRTPTWVSQDTDAWRIPMEPDFKELALGSNAVDKVFVKANLSAYFDVKQHVWLDVLANGGDLKMHMGPAVIGDFNLSRLAAKNDLGLLTLDVSSLAKSFQARRLSPNDNSREVTTTFAPGVVRGRTLQPCLREGQGIVIDDTNDHLVVAGFDYGPGVPANPSVTSVVLVQDYYSDVDALIGHIITQLNAQSPIVGRLGHLFASVSAFQNDTPYTNNIGIAGSDGTFFPVFLFALDEDQFTLNGVTLYLQRSMRLLATLGFDTSTAYSDALVATAVVGVYPLDGGNSCSVLGPNITGMATSNDAIISAIQSIPFVQSAIVAVSEITGTFVRKSNQPIGTADRQS